MPTSFAVVTKFKADNRTSVPSVGARRLPPIASNTQYEHILDLLAFEHLAGCWQYLNRTGTLGIFFAESFPELAGGDLFEDFELGVLPYMADYQRISVADFYETGDLLLDSSVGDIS